MCYLNGDPLRTAGALTFALIFYVNYMMENWKQIQLTGYWISQSGQVKNSKGKIIGNKTDWGYVRTSISGKYTFIHRLLEQSLKKKRKK